MAQPAVLITGASRGIGRAIALEFAAAGYPVGINYLKNEEAAQELQRMIARRGGRSVLLRADVSREEEVAEMFARAEKHLGFVGVLVNNAGIAHQGLFMDMTAEEWDKIFAVDVRGPFLCARAAAEKMIAHQWGRIINLSSIWGITGASCETAYSAAKAAVIGMTRALAKELGPAGITVNAIAPGVIATEMNAHLDEQALTALKEETPLGRIGTPEEVARCALFLASSGGDFITGQVISPNGGIVI